jgi:hypothetical protein
MFSLNRGRERDQRNIPRLLDRLSQPALVRRAYARNAPRRNLPALGNERQQQPHFLVIDIVDFIDTEPAHLLAPEILFLARDGFIAAGGTLRAADWSSALGFCHIIPSPLPRPLL